MNNGMNQSFTFHVGRIRKAIRREFEEQAAPLGITVAQFQVLRRLWEGDGILTSVLTKDTCSDGGTITGLLDRLACKGLIVRERSEEDRRAVQIRLTEAGRSLEPVLMNIIESINGRALAGLSADDRQQLMDLMNKVGGNLEA